MRRSAILGTWILLLVTCPVIASAQGAFGLPQSSLVEVEGSEVMPAATSPGVINWWLGGDVRVWSTLKVGYKRIGLNFNLNIPPTQVLTPFVIFPNFGTLLDTFPLNAKIQNADLLMGGIRLDAQVTPSFGLFGSLAASIPRSIGIEASEGPGIGVLTEQGWSWHGSRLQWSEFACGGSYKASSGLDFVAGLRFDRLTVRFSEPQPVPGYGFFNIFPLPPHIVTANFPDYSGDLTTLLTIPHLGFELFGPYFKGTFLIGSAGARLKLPLQLSRSGI